MNDRLRAIRVLHTAAWAFFAGCILALPVAAYLHRFRWAAWLAAWALVECGVLAANRWHCPLTGIAERDTEDRAPNFDIYLPRWLAQHNKLLFGALFVAGGTFALWEWLRS